MLIINKYNIVTPVAVDATNNAVLATGITGARWGGINPNAATGATGNALENDGLVYVTSTSVYKEEVISMLVQVQVSGALKAGVANYIKIPLSNLGISGTKVIKSAMLLGVFDQNATNDGVTPTASVIQFLPVTVVTLSVVKDAIVIKVANLSQPLLQNKFLNILLIYSNY